MPHLKFPFYVLSRNPKTDPIERSSILRPLVKIELRGPKGAIPVLALIDSGSDDTLFDCELADAVGIDWRSGRSYDVHGVGGGSVQVHFKQGTYAIEGHPITTNIGFTDLPKAYKTLLGQTGFFDRTIVTLDHSNQRIEIRF